MINAAGVPLLLAAMALSSGVALCLGAGLLLRRTGVEGYMCVIAEYVWVTLWVVMAFAVFAVVGVLVFRMLSRRLTRPIEKFARDVDALVRCDKSDPVDADTRIAEIDALAAAFNRLQSVRARQSDEIRNLARNVLHDLRAPITNIYNEADRLAHSLVGADEASAAIMSASRSVLRIIDTNAEISRNYSGCADAPASSQDMSAIVRDAVDVYAAVAEEKGVCLKVEMPDEAVFMMGHADKLQRLVGNLVDNAIKFTPVGGSICVGLSAAADGIRLSVSDTGIGIPRDEIDCIYERFYRCVGARTSPGTGLGLSMVRSIVEFYAGTISCHSTPNSGTTFLVHFPMSVMSTQLLPATPTTVPSES